MSWREHLKQAMNNRRRYFVFNGVEFAFILNTKETLYQHFDLLIG
jgi:hypothetical protein